MFAPVTQITVKQAFEMVFPAIISCMDRHTFKRADMHIVVLNPYMDPEYGEEAIIFEFAVGDKTKWEHPYDEIARAKAFSAARHQMSTDTLRRLYPHLMQPEDTVHCGGVNFEGIPIGVSGVQGYFDELVANWLGATIVALCKARMAEILEDKSIDTLGQAQFVSK